MFVGKRLFVGNLPHQVSSSDLDQLFSEFGTVQSVQIVLGRHSDRSKGFGFVEMDSEAEAQAAIQGLLDREIDGRRLTVDEARPRTYRGGGGGGGVGFGGGDYAGGGSSGRRWSSGVRMKWREMERRAELDAAQPRPTEIGEDMLQLSLTLGNELDRQP